MAEHLGDLTRTHTCGALRDSDVGQSVVILGWVHRIRDLGGVTFLDIRDRAGVSQVVVRENDALMAVASIASSWSWVTITKVRPMSENTVFELM